MTITSYNILAQRAFTGYAAYYNHALKPNETSIYMYFSWWSRPVSCGKQSQRLSTQRFIPCGIVVVSSLIHLLSLTLSKVGSTLHNWSITITAMSSTKCALLLNYITTGDSSVHQCVVKSMAVDPAVEGLNCFPYIMVATPLEFY